MEARRKSGRRSPSSSVNSPALQAGTAKPAGAAASRWRHGLKRRWRKVACWAAVLLVVGVGGPLGLSLRSAAARQKAVRALRERGGQIGYRGESATATRAPSPDEEELLFHLWAEVTTVDLGGTEAGDAELALFDALPTVEVLVLRDTQVTDAGLDRLRRLTRLHYLDLHGTRITDAGLAVVGQFVELDDLDLSHNRLSDRGLGQLRDLLRLRSLDIGETGVSDTGVGQLGQLKELRWLGADQTRVSAAGARRVRQLLPQAVVSVSPRASDHSPVAPGDVDASLLAR
jgi:hypothetical protein